MIDKIKTYTIILLIIITVYQFIDFWFGGVYNTSLIKTIQNINGSKDEYENYFLRPSNIMASFGNKQYALIKSTRRESQIIEKYLEKVYTDISSKKLILKEETENLSNIYSKKGVIIEYDSDNIEDKNLKELLGIKNDTVLKNLNRIDRVVLVASNVRTKTMTAYFVNNISKEENIIYKVELEDSAQEIYNLIDEMQDSGQASIYISTLYDASSRYFLRENFLPAIINDLSFIEQKPKVINPFIIGGEFNEDMTEYYANGYFDNPRAKWKIKKSEDTIIYGDGEKSIRINSDGIIDYSKDVVNNNVEISFDKAFNVIERFIKRDIYSNNEMYVLDVERLDKYNIKISYGYRIGGYNYVISGDILSAYDMVAPIEIIITGDEIASYKKFILNVEFEPNVETQEFISYIEVFDTILVKLEGELLDKMYLAYYQKDISEAPKFSWILETAKRIFTVPAIKG